MIKLAFDRNAVTLVRGLLVVIAASTLICRYAAAAEDKPAESVALIIDTKQFATDARRGAIAKILVRQPGATRIFAYAIGSGDHAQLWPAKPQSERAINPAERSVNLSDLPDVQSALSQFVARHRGNPGRSLARIIDRIALAVREHAAAMERRAEAGQPPGEAGARLRLLVAVQEIVPYLEPDAVRSLCPPGSDRSGWIDDKIRLGELNRRGSRKQQATAFWVYDAGDRDAKQVNRNVEEFLHAGLGREHIEFGGVYYLQESTLPPRDPRGDYARPPCAYLKVFVEPRDAPKDEAQEVQDEDLVVRTAAPQPNAAAPALAQGPQTGVGAGAGAHPAPPQPQAQQAPRPVQRVAAPPPRQDPRLANCPFVPDMGPIDQYVAGNDLTPAAAGKLFTNWTRVDCHVWTIIETPGRSSFERGRALRLLRVANARAGKGDWQPQSSHKKDSRNFSADLPYLHSDDYRTIFDFARSDDAALRDEARTFIRTFPVDKFEPLFADAYKRRKELPADELERVAMAATAFYYNRIVEYLDEAPATTSGLSPDQKTAANAAIDRYLREGLSWTADSLFVGGNGKAHEAMLHYAVAITQRVKELQPDLGKKEFKAMLDALRDSTQQYPTNPKHIAQALAYVEVGGSVGSLKELLKKIDASEPLQGTFLDQIGLPVGTEVDLFAGPGDQYPPQNKHLEVRPDIRVLLRSDDWYLAQTKGFVGWIERQ